MVSHRLKCIFVHIPKTAGTSIENKLGHFDELKYGVQDHRTLRDFEPVRWRSLPLNLKYGAWRPLAKKVLRRVDSDNGCTAEQFDSYFKFSIVRNPWSRVYSWYRDVCRDPILQTSLNVRADWPFEVFLTKELHEWGLLPQMFWIRNWRGKIGVDFVGRFETLQSDFSYVAGRLGLSDAILPKLMSFDDDPMAYIEKYDSKSRQIIAQVYREEIEYFDYEFGA